jgi:hypothetical protein
MAARAALNLLIAAYCTHLARKEDLCRRHVNTDPGVAFSRR